MIATLRWDGDWLRLDCGPWSIAVADIEVYEDETATAYLAGWVGGDVLPGDCTPVVGGGHFNTDSGQEVACATRAEAVAVIRALLGLRGVDVPEPDATAAEAAREDADR